MDTIRRFCAAFFWQTGVPETRSLDEEPKEAPIAKEKQVRVNDEITAPRVRVIEESGDFIGVLGINEALDTAFERGMDLVEVAPQAEPPVCKLMDFGKYKYQQKKRTQEAKKKQVQIQVKEVKFRPKTDEHDIEYKVRNILRFFDEGNKAKVTVVYRGREMSHQDQGLAVIERVIQLIGDAALVESQPKMEGRFLSMVLAPAKKGR